MILSARQSELSGTVSIPGSKSHTIRAVAIAALAKGVSAIGRPLVSSDTLSAVTCYRGLGADIDIDDPDAWHVKGCGGKIKLCQDTIDVGNSGTTLRLAAGSAALAKQDQSIIFTGDEQIRSRPIGQLLDSLNDLGAKCSCIEGNGKAPITIAGRLKGGATTIECKTSQYLSSLLIAAPLADGDSLIDVSLLNEPGYVQMTLDWLDVQGIEYNNEDFKQFKVNGGQSYTGFETDIPADFSSATFFLCAAALFADEVTICGLDTSDSQPDKEVIDYLRQMGADIQIGENSIKVKGGNLEGAQIDLNRTPDALPAMAVVAAFAKGQTRLVNVAHARTKETDRISCMACELKKMKIEVEEIADGLIIHGGQPLAAKLSGHGDHRIVMALGFGALGIKDGCSIDDAEAMNITFPNYVELMKQLGADMELKN